MKKRLFSLLMTLVLLLSVLPVPANAAEDTITVYNWGQYISDGSDGSLDVIAAFEEETGIKVNYVTFDSNESMYTKLKTGGTSYDVIIPSDYMIAKLIEEDMLLPLNYDNIPNYQYIDEQLHNPTYDPENLYSVPYTRGTVGIIYNTKYVDEVTSWSSLFDANYAGKILMFDNCRDAFAIGESMLGYSLNTNDLNELQDVANLLATQKDLVQSYVMDQIFDKMIREEAWIAPYYAGDYIYMVEENPDLAFCFPEEGFNSFVDAMCIPASCENKEGAEAFINFMCRPDICAANLEYIGYTAPMEAAKEYMDPEVAEDPVTYPGEEVLARSTSFVNLSLEATQHMNNLWLSVKTSGDDAGRYLLITGVILLFVLLWIGLQKLRRRRRKARRCAKWKQQNT